MEMEEKNVKIGFVTKYDETFTSISCGCIRFFDSYRFLQVSLGDLCNTSGYEDF